MSLRADLHAGRKRLGPFLNIPSTTTAEIVCAVRPDFVCIDGEHAPMSGPILPDLIRCADLYRVPVLVRVPGCDGAAIAAALDAGAAGVLVPRVSSPQEAAEAVAAARYPPEGRRGAGPGRAGAYGPGIAAYMPEARRETLVAIQLETVEAVEQAEAILAVPGLDLGFIGPGDLGVCLAAAGQPGRTALMTAIDAILAAAATARVPAGIYAHTPEEAARWLTRLTLVLCGSDAGMLAEASATRFSRQ